VTNSPPFDLGQVINAMERDVLANCRPDSESEDKEGVIIVGHSVGAYIALEIIQRHRARLEKMQPDSLTDEPRIVGGVCLFPTVMDIGKSPKGKVLTVSSHVLFQCYCFSFFRSPSLVTP